jgi:hypothetical protein
MSLGKGTLSIQTSPFTLSTPVVQEIFLLHVAINLPCLRDQENLQELTKSADRALLQFDEVQYICQMLHGSHSMPLSG